MSTKYRATIQRPQLHDGRWTWALEELRHDQREGGFWAKVPEVGHGQYPTGGSATTRHEAVLRARSAKVWYEQQRAHEGKPATETIDFR